jgi:hypothetical protein
MDQDRFAMQVAEIRTLLEERLKIRGRSLDRQVKKAGRLLPRKVRQQARYLAQAETLAQNPKLLRMIDWPKAETAHADVVAWLSAIDPSERRWTRIINMLALIAFNLLLLGGLLVWFLLWRGIV